MAEPTAASHRVLSGLHWIDGTIVVAYACGMLALGWYYSRRQTSTDEYFVGNREMHPVLIGVSLFATLFSTISYLSFPGELVRHGPTALTVVLVIPFMYVIVGYLMIPVYMRYRVTSAYELLEKRLGLAARLTGATMFILMRLTWMSLLIYFASYAMVVMLGAGEGWLFPVIAVTAAVAILYSSMGGLRAVVITDLIQSLLLLTGAVLVLITVSARLGGLTWFPTEWNPTWDTQPLFSLDPAVRVTMFNTIVSGTIWWICTAGGDQTAIQRFMSTSNAESARRSFLMHATAGAVVLTMLALVGFALLGYFQQGGKLPDGWDLRTDADRLFPFFISHHLPVGVSGLVVSGMFAAAMSSIDSGVNSITAVVMTDYVDRFRAEPIEERSHLLFAKVLAVGIGLAVIGISGYLQYVPGNFLEVTRKSFELLTVPIFVLFFMAMFTSFGTQRGAIGGAVIAFATGVVVAYWDILVERWNLPVSVTTVSFQYIFPVALVVGLSAACLLSLLDRRAGRRH